MVHLQYEEFWRKKIKSYSGSDGSMTRTGNFMDSDPNCILLDGKLVDIKVNYTSLRHQKIYSEIYQI